MAIDKYKLIKGKFVNISPYIYQAVESDRIDHDLIESESGKRIIAAASGIGWWLQVPEGVVLRIPVDLTQILKLKEEIE